ncbi:hypothetical protein [Aurantiacibacter hainanensis]|uniref:hypothetical protein n=1 Tax=Aurantiacibacter hainanensis TaxID=3076114 RepID=UPI0030C6C980
MGLRPLTSMGMFAATLALAAPALSQEAGDSVPALGTEIFASGDSDNTTILRAALDFDLRNDGDADRIGIRLENAWYEPLGGPVRERQRVFLQAGDRSDEWTWAARLGTDGNDVIGSASIHDESRFRKEFFIERDIIETPLGLERDLYTTFAGGVIDLPVDDRNIFTVLTGLQEFSGDNERIHLRANFIHVLKPDAGLSVQLRTRYFHSTEPGEFDYFSPRDFGQVLPTVQLRRFVGGWQFLAVGGLGAQRFTGGDWRQANYAEGRVQSPSVGPWNITVEVIYANTPGNNAVQAGGYDYVQGRFAIRRRF